MLLSRIQAVEDAAGRIDWDVSVDSTAVRAHQHAAGARKAPAVAVAQKGITGGTNQVDPVLRKLTVRLEEVVISASVWDVPAAASPPESTVPPTDDAGPSPSPETPGHYGDGTQFERVLEQVSVPRIGVGRPRTRPDHALADKTYTSRKNRRHLRRRGIRHTIPEHLDQQRHRKKRGSRGGRPTGFEQRVIQEAQHRRTRNQPPKRLPRGRHPLRETRLHLPRHRHTRRNTRHRSDTSTTVRPISMISFTEPGNRIHPNRSLPHRRRSTGRIRGAWVQGRNASPVLALQFPHVHAVDSSDHRQHPVRAKPDALTLEVRHLPPLREHRISGASPRVPLRSGRRP